MKRLFNNPWFIAALACFALYYVYDNAVAPYWSSKKVTNDDVPTFIEDVIGTTLNDSEGSETLRKVNIHDLYWNETPTRDPFSPKPIISQKDLDEAIKIRQKNDAKKQKEIKKKNIITKQNKKITPEKPEPLPVLSGFVAGLTTRQAVVDGNIVSEGEVLEKFQIVSIKTDGVLIKNRGKGTVHFITVTK